MTKTDALLVCVAEYPNSNNVLPPLPGAALDNKRVRKWLEHNAPELEVRDLCWPPSESIPPAGGGPKPDLWSASKVTDAFIFLANRATANYPPRDRLFVYFSGHGKLKPTYPAFPALYCAQHKRDMPDLFPSYFWLPALTVLPAYREYLIFLDCCNAQEFDPLPPEPNIPLDPRTDRASVLMVTASEANQTALEEPEEGGVFTSVLLEALSGSAGSPDSDIVTAIDVVNYLKANVPERAKKVKAGHTQIPQEWFDPRFTPLNEYELFRREKVNGVDVSHLLNGHAAADIDVLTASMQPIATLADGPGGAALLGSVYPGKYLLKDRNDGWLQLIKIRTQVALDGSTKAVADAMTLS